jgi:hypothetical protein
VDMACRGRPKCPIISRFQSIKNVFNASIACFEACSFASASEVLFGERLPYIELYPASHPTHLKTLV